MLKKSAGEVIEEYIFSSKANIGGPGVEGHPRMLNRFLAAIVHPMIHVGCGLEFGLPGLVAEGEHEFPCDVMKLMTSSLSGLAQSAVHSDQGGDVLVPPTLFEAHTAHVKRASGVSRLSAMLPSLKLSRSPSSGGYAAAPTVEAKAGTHAFNILARLLADEKFKVSKIELPQSESAFEYVNKDVGKSLDELAGEWAAELDGEGATLAVIDKKIEELVWMNTIIFGVGGWGGREKGEFKEFNADFF